MAFEQKQIWHQLKTFLNYWDSPNSLVSLYSWNIILFFSPQILYLKLTSPFGYEQYVDNIFYTLCQTAKILKIFLIIIKSFCRYNSFLYRFKTLKVFYPLLWAWGCAQENRDCHKCVHQINKLLHCMRLCQGLSHSKENTGSCSNHKSTSFLKFTKFILRMLLYF